MIDMVFNTLIIASILPNFAAIFYGFATLYKHHLMLSIFKLHAIMFTVIIACMYLPLIYRWWEATGWHLESMTEYGIGYMIPLGWMIYHVGACTTAAILHYKWWREV